ncbi:MAG: 16S rRNA (guanine(1207)-N(2))-methyltransferase RsmC [Serratia symbiotica]|nr:16S rRNA (guanine(1207)-N(2))-methyltransferase RsmC [Serratia symbiotica]
MSALTPASEVMLRHSDEFIKRRVLLAGDLQDTLPGLLEATEVRVHTQQYHHWQLLNRAMGDNAQFGLTLDAAFVVECDTLIYYWPKSKQEAQFQLCNILALLPVGADVFVVGENRSGVRSAEQTVAGHATLMKIDSARRCGLYHGRLDVQTTFDLTDWWQSYSLHDLAVKTLPGVFSRNGLDTGSALLLSTLEDSMQGKVLDIGCGPGVVAAVLAKLSPKVKLTLSDVSAAALDSSRATLAANDIKGEVIVSNVYSNITGHFDMIISNPPFHDGLPNSLTTAEILIRGALKHLPIGGRLRIVANAFLPYPGILNATFGSHEVLAQNGRFKVYQATVGLPPRDPKKKKK